MRAAINFFLSISFYGLFVLSSHASVSRDGDDMMAGIAGAGSNKPPTLQNFNPQIIISDSSKISSPIQSQVELNKDQKLNQIIALRGYFKKGLLEITPKTCLDLLHYAGSYKEAFAAYDRGVSLRGWSDKDETGELIKLFYHFNMIKSIKCRKNTWQSKILVNTLGDAIQYYNYLDTLDLKDSGLNDKEVLKLLKTLPNPSSLKSLNIKSSILENQTLSQIKKQCPKLEELIISETALKMSEHIEPASLQTTTVLLGDTTIKEQKAPSPAVSIHPSSDFTLKEELDADAQFKLGEYHFKMNNNIAEALDWYTKAANQNHVFAQQRLSDIYVAKQGIFIVPQNAFSQLQKKTSKTAIEELIVGWMYRDGLGVQKDEVEAVSWIRKAAEKGIVDAQFWLGWMYAIGQGVSVDEKEAATWFRKAAEQGHTIAQNNLGTMYADGRGVSMDENEAATWVRKAAEQGYMVAQNNLAMMYADGRGVSKDEKEAIKWYKKAADQGYEAAQKKLSTLMNSKKLTDKDILDALNNVQAKTLSIEDFAIFVNSDPSLTTLNLHNSMVGSLDLEKVKALATALKDSKTITSIDLSSNWLDNDGAHAIAPGLKDNKSITKLDLSCNKIGGWGGHAIAEIIAQNKTITTIDLHGNTFGVGGTEPIAAALKVNKTITTVNLSTTPIGVGGIEALIEALKINNTITKLDLIGSKIGVGGEKALKDFIRHSRSSLKIVY